jgi:uroporphyrinogen-III synthase
MLPLSNRRIVVTRTRQQASELAAKLEVLGAIAVLLPTIEIVPPESFGPLDDALMQLDWFDWLIFTSANAVEAFAQRLKHCKVNTSTSMPRIAVVGPATARAVEAIGHTVALLPARYVAESLAESLLPHASGKRMLLVRAEEARNLLPDALVPAGAAVTIVAAYRNRIPTASLESIRKIFSSLSERPDAVTFTSASTARNFSALLEGAALAIPPDTQLASIGPITSEALRELGYSPTIEARESTISGLVDAIAKFFRGLG